MTVQKLVTLLKPSFGTAILDSKGLPLDHIFEPSERQENTDTSNIPKTLFDGGFIHTGKSAGSVTCKKTLPPCSVSYKDSSFVWTRSSHDQEPCWLLLPGTMLFGFIATCLRFLTAVSALRHLSTLYHLFVWSVEDMVYRLLHRGLSAWSAPQIANHCSFLSEQSNYRSAISSMPY